MNEVSLPKPVRTTSSIRRVMIYAALLLVGFLFGFVPMWLKSRECSGSLSQAEHQLSIGRIENELASAAIDARRGAYEPARQAASNFFTSLRAETDRGNDSVFSQTQRDGLPPLLVRRDETITLLARNEPVSADRLVDLYMSYRKIMNKWRVTKEVSLVRDGDAVVLAGTYHNAINPSKMTQSLIGVSNLDHMCELYWTDTWLISKV